MISAAMIVKNEERCVARAINSLLLAVDEIIVVDTGSTDRTIDIIRELQAKHDKVKLHHFEWQDNFAAARNYSLSLVSHEWVFSIDADEVLLEEHWDRPRKYTQWLDNQGKKAAMHIVLDNTVAGEITNTYETGCVRIFPSDLRYVDMVHETVDTTGLETMKSDIHLLHDGYDQAAVNQLDKKKRNLLLLHKNLKVDPRNAHLWFQLGREMMDFDQAKGNHYLDIAASFTTDQSLLNWISKSRK
ncbi:glycosyl transferase family 2 [Paenibacillus cellulosilyticus]|uniref:Glycosyl transferase family 2 n=1 Tax=Paenibacillus cellulosilyticus TaxID=375489 RepID=A0A2V2YSU2_9BACL|nr:glycosyltransferase family 2 protein [Paenibacillus cellulosilyticus]PWV97996.1 glycosyl transferase family 2 [Paenibacillus cellulosilyticus]QKS43979.1 glycosyltransferase family 2 protein [Paenibacillus cellulosilyticus]